MFWRYSFNFQTSLSTTINLVHTLKKSLCGFWAKIFWKFIHKSNILSLLCLGETALTFKDLYQHTYMKLVHTLKKSLWRFWSIIFWKIIHKFTDFVTVVFGKMGLDVGGCGTGLFWGGRFYGWTFLLWEIVVLDYFAVGDSTAGLFCCGRFWCWTF